uniref:Uncharacterized protein n=1 Tax=Sinocyclocheilus grahami TaxID=75366 RepID=A0A672KX42_SINGR
MVCHLQCVHIIHINHLIFFFQGVGTDPHMAVVLPTDAKLKKKSSMSGLSEEEQLSIRIGRAGVHSGKLFFTDPQRTKVFWVWSSVRVNNDRVFISI